MLERVVRPRVMELGDPREAQMEALECKPGKHHRLRRRHGHHRVEVLPAQQAVGLPDDRGNPAGLHIGKARVTQHPALVFPRRPRRRDDLA